MMGIIKPAVLAILLFLGGCSVHSGIAADSITTAAAISSGAGQEANPLLPSSAAGAALVSAALKYAMLYGIRHYDPVSCPRAARSVIAGGYGAGVNNLLVMAGFTGPAPLIAGLIAGLVGWDNAQTAADHFCKE